MTSAYSARPQYSKQQSNSYNAKKSHQQPASHSYSSAEKESQILRNDMEVKGDGSYHYDFETSNGIKRSEQGAVDGTIQGSSSYISPEGVEIKTSYVADETGYHPVGDHIPQIPDYIVRALEYIKTHPFIEKDYYTGEVKQTSFSNKKPLTTTATKRSAYSHNDNYNKKGSNNSKNNFRH